LLKNIVYYRQIVTLHKKLHNGIWLLFLTTNMNMLLLFIDSIALLKTITTFPGIE